MPRWLTERRVVGATSRTARYPETPRGIAPYKGQTCSCSRPRFTPIISGLLAASGACLSPPQLLQRRPRHLIHRVGPQRRLELRSRLRPFSLTQIDHAEVGMRLGVVGL